MTIGNSGIPQLFMALLVFSQVCIFVTKSEQISLTLHPDTFMTFEELVHKYGFQFE